MNKKLKRTLIGVAATYSVSLLGMYIRQRNILYRAPVKHQTEDIPVELLDVDVNDPKNNPSMLGWILNVGKKKALIYFGGSSESIELRMDILKKNFPDHTIYLMPYRGFGPNRLHKMEESGIKRDACRLYEYVSRVHSKVDLIGRSLGTGMAIHVASKYNVENVALITPYDSILEVARHRYMFIFPVGKLLHDKFESWRDASFVKSKLCVISAKTDYVTPIVRWQRLETFLTNVSGISHCFIDNTNHTNIVESQETWNVIKESFIEKQVLSELDVKKSLLNSDDVEQTVASKTEFDLSNFKEYFYDEGKENYYELNQVEILEKK